MSDTQVLILKRLQEESAKARALFDSLRPEQWSQQVYVDGSGWQVRHVLCHLLNAEQGLSAIVRDVLAGGQGAPAGLIDVFAYNEAQVGRMDASDPAARLAELNAARAATIATVEAMQEADFALEGRHPFFGPVSLEKMLKWIYRHTMIHLRDIRRALETGVPADAQDA